jgi:hypothetical protein
VRLATLCVVVGCASGEKQPPPPRASTPHTPHTPLAPLAPHGPLPALGGRDAVPPAPTTSVELTFAGDIMFGRFDPDKGFFAIRAEKYDPFVEVAPLLASDLALVNLETPVMRKPPKKSAHGTRMRFVASAARAATLPRHGMTLVTLANNHFWDMKRAGAEETPVVLAELGVRAIGAARAEDPLFRVEVVDVKEWKVGFIAASTICNTDCDRARPRLPYAEDADLADQLVPVVAAARADPALDLVIVSLHWGDEYLAAPESWQVDAAHRLIDAGANAVIAHHPHVLQGIERYKDGLVAYSLGNLLFDTTKGATKWSGVLRLGFEKPAGGAACLASARFHPILVKRPDDEMPVFRPTVATGKSFDAVATRLQTGSRADVLTATDWTVDGDVLATPGACH